jgi:hypothetical protein
VAVLVVRLTIELSADGRPEQVARLARDAVAARLQRGALNGGVTLGQVLDISYGVEGVESPSG